MTVSAEVQSLLDKARQNRSLVGSVDHGVAAMRVQISQLIEKLNAIPVAPAPSLSEEDKAGILEAAGELDASAETLKSDIPANVVEGQPAPADSGDGAPKPLAGTGEG